MFIGFSLKNLDGHWKEWLLMSVYSTEHHTVLFTACMLSELACSTQWRFKHDYWKHTKIFLQTCTDYWTRCPVIYKVNCIIIARKCLWERMCKSVVVSHVGFIHWWRYFDAAKCVVRQMQMCPMSTAKSQNVDSPQFVRRSAAEWRWCVAVISAHLHRSGCTAVS